MIPTIETIVEDLAAGKITKQQAIAWLHQHAQDAGRELRDEIAITMLPALYTESCKHNGVTRHDVIDESLAYARDFLAAAHRR